ncbi:MAG: hypothetical protein R3F62_16625 [Planctomycetota bacterium]
MPTATKDHYAPLDPAESAVAVDPTQVVYLGPYCDEEHAREELTPLLASHGARLESADEPEIGDHLFNATLLTTSEGMWVGLQAQYALGASDEFTEYGFQAVAGGAQVRIHPLKGEGQTLLRTAAIAEYPGSADDAAKAELCARGNTATCTVRRLIVERIPG